MRYQSLRILAATALLISPQLVFAQRSFPYSWNWQRGPASGSVTLTSLGARADGSDAAGTTAALQRAFQANLTGEIVVTPGTYLIDNSRGPVIVYGFGGTLRFEDGAQFVYTNSNESGISFGGGTGAKILGYRGTYRTMPGTRINDHQQLGFYQTIDTEVDGAVIQGSPAAGILAFQTTRAKISDTTIIGTMADGVHLANTQDTQVTKLTTRDTGDDGLAFLNYGMFMDYSGGTASDISIYNSKARGITVVGQSNVSISDFRVESTSSSGILCAADPNFNTRVPSSVRFSGGSIVNAGTLKPLGGNQFGIEFFHQESCSFSNIEVVGSGDRGLGGVAPNGRVSVQNVRVSGNGSNEAFAFHQTSLVEISDSTAQTVPSYGFYFSQVGTVVARNLSAIDVSQNFSLNRAIWFDGVNTITASNLSVIDRKDKPTGYTVGAGQCTSATRGSISLGAVAIRNGALRIENTCRALQIQ